MTKKQLLEDLFLAVKHYLINRGREENIAIIVATKFVDEAIKNKLTKEEITNLRNEFLY